MTLFAFDRDHTVDVEPHPERRAVPLAWVRHLAHETDHAVWAIGNQRLTDEADVPGVAEIVDRVDGADAVDDLGDQDRLVSVPSRRERLRLLERHGPDAARRIVVDDRDLGDVDGWTHFFPWEFVDAVETGSFDLDADFPDGA